LAYATGRAERCRLFVTERKFSGVSYRLVAGCYLDNLALTDFDDVPGLPLGCFITFDSPSKFDGKSYEWALHRAATGIESKAAYTGELDQYDILPIGMWDIKKKLGHIVGATDAGILYVPPNTSFPD
jgi:hypothetical protein